MSLSSSPPPRSETGTPRPHTFVSLNLSSSPESSSLPPGSETGTPRPHTVVSLNLSSSPESSPTPERKLEDKGRSPDGSCNQGPLSPGTPVPCHEPASPSYLSTTPSSPPGSETGTPRPYTVVSLTLSSSPKSLLERKRKREDEDEDKNKD